MPTLLAEPRFLSSSCDLLRDGSHLTVLERSWFRERASFALDGAIYGMARDGFLGPFVLAQGDAVVASAVKEGLLSQTFRVSAAGRALTLQAAGTFSYGFRVLEKDADVASLRRRGFLAPRSEGTFPGDLSAPVQIFLLWLAMTMWRRADQS